MAFVKPDALTARRPRLYTCRRLGEYIRRRFALKNFRLQACTLGGFLIVALLAPCWSAAAAAQTKTRIIPDAPAHKYPHRERGALDMADGQIKDVQCRGRAMDMVFDDSNEILRLHTDNYFKVDFSAINFTPKGILNPCKQAKGMYARVHFYHIKGHPREGELTSVELRK